ncbi:serine/threonine-protein kinase [Streptomyces sp. NPDC086766]|uniref:serine/threonine-protein kinase n=1 Tax=Streptomyces sp. NPDC086766 TaxID=3365754 RepID=UPI0037F61E2D
MQQIGAYTIERVLGEGGMGTVYLGRSRGGRSVAVKVAKPELARDPGFRERFRAEITAARAVGGFHTAPVVDADPDAESPWLATAYVPGPTLADLLTARGPMDAAALRQLGLALAEALQAIHACGLVHRDLKPGNIIMADDGPRVVDFGIARAVEASRLTVTGAALGTPGFLAPEQAEGLPVTAAADVFALGAVLVAAAGGSAFGEGTPMMLMYRSVHQDADMSAVPAGLRATVALCMAKDPGQRPSAGELLDLLAPPQGGTPPAHTPPSYTPTAYAPPAALPTPPPHGVATPPPPGTAPSPTPATPATPPQPGHASPPPQPGYATASPQRHPTPPPQAGYASTPPPPGHSTPPPQAAAASLPTVSAPSPYPPYPASSPPPAPQGFGPQGFGPPAAGGAAGEAAPGGQEFLAMDHKNAVVADAHGISLGINGHPVDFPWSAVRAVTHSESGRGLSLTVTLHFHDGATRSCRITTRDEDELDDWIEQLTLVVERFLGQGRQ